MSGLKIFAAKNYNGKNMIIGLDNSCITVTNSIAEAWGQKTPFLKIFKDGELPKWLGI